MFKNKRRAVALALAVPFVLTSCSTSSTTQGSTGAGAAISIAGVAPLSNDPYFITMKCGAIAKGKELGATVTWNGPAGADVSDTLAAFRTALLTKPSGVVLVPFSETAFNADITSAMKAGTAVATADGAVSEPITIGGLQTDYSTVSSVVVKEISDAMPTGGEVAVIGFQVGNPPDEARYTGWVSAIGNERPDIKVLPIEYAGADASKAAQIASSLLVAHPDLKIIYTTNANLASGVLSALRGSKSGSASLITFDAPATIIDAIKKGTVRAAIAQSAYLEGAGAVQLIVDSIQSTIRPFPVANETKKLPVKLITSSNVDSADVKPYLLDSSC